MALPPLTQPPVPPKTGNQVLDDYIFRLYKWHDLLWRKLGKDTESAELSITGSATSADAVTPISGSGSPEGATTAAPGTIYTDSDTGNVYLKTDGADSSGWRQVQLT